MNFKLDMIDFLEKTGQPINESQLSLFREIKNAIEPKLFAFKKAIRREEKKKDCFIMIHILAPEDQWHLPVEKQRDQMRLTLHGYSPSLTSSIYQALGDNKWASHIKEPKLAETSLN